jgi:hypothetical protein
MKNFYLKMFSLLFLLFTGITAQAQEWNISSASFNTLTTIATTTTVQGLTMWSPASEIVIDANGKSWGGFTFTHRLKLGGTGTFEADNVTPATRVVSFPVTGNTTITVAAMSSSGTADRILVIAAGNKTGEVGRFTALGASLNGSDFNYVGGPTTIFLFSTSSGINIYYIKAALTTGMNEMKSPKLRIFPNPAEEIVSINVDKTGKIGIYNSAGTLMKQQQASPDQNNIDISDLNPGMYYVKMINSQNTAQKLIVR